MPLNPQILVINAGSSSIKFALYGAANTLQKELSGKIERINSPGTTLNFTAADSKDEIVEAGSLNFPQAADFLMDWLEKQNIPDSIQAIGHRVVHGMQHTQPQLIDEQLLAGLKKIQLYDPDHLPQEIELIVNFRKRYSKIKQVACFDTAFHANMPRVAKLLPIPRRFDSQGIQRYGFHGISFAYLMEQLTVVSDGKFEKVILAHLGSGCSLAAVLNGQCVDTSMGFTPASGIMMGTRPGDLDPGVAWYMMQSESLNAKQFNDLINHQSGLLGVSETSADVRDLLKIESTDKRAAEAIALFCYQVKKFIGAYTAVLGGLDTLVFAGGIGENAPVIRQRICEGLDYLGIELDEKSNENNEAIISIENNPVTIRVIHTDEESMIAKMVCSILNLNIVK